jgi:cyclopropane fatty-acyl-phospholipid synthase-like methyltransferase
MTSATSPVGVPPPGASDPAALLAALPAARALHEFLVRSQHLHFGFFESPTDTLAQAQERLVARSARLLPRGALVTDVGCGLGGTVNLLAAQGHTVFGIEPCARSLAYARSRPGSARARFLEVDLAGFALRARGARFDAVVLCEVLRELSDLAAVFAHCRALLRPGGLVLLHDVVRVAGDEPSRRRHHTRAAVRAAADAAGFDLLEARDVTVRAVPTLSRLARLLEERRAELRTALGPARPALDEELGAFEAERRALELGFSRQELVYESCALRCSARFTNDSVVVRPRPTVVPTYPPQV